jgi:hypothetical protein
MSSSNCSNNEVMLHGKKLLKNQTFTPDNVRIKVIVLLFLMLCEKPPLCCTTIAESTAELPLSHKLAASKPSIHHHHASNHRATRQALQGNLFAQDGPAQASRGEAKQRSIALRGKTATDVDPVWARLGGLRKNNGLKTKRVCQLIHRGSRQLFGLLLSLDLSVLRLNSDELAQSRKALSHATLLKEALVTRNTLPSQRYIVERVLKPWLARKLNRESLERTSVDFWRLAALVVDQCAALKAQPAIGS